MKEPDLKEEISEDRPSGAWGSAVDGARTQGDRVESRRGSARTCPGRLEISRESDPECRELLAFVNQSPTPVPPRSGGPREAGIDHGDGFLDVYRC